VITQNTARRPSLDHRPYQLDGLDLLRSAINQIADEDGRAGPMAVGASRAGITQMLEQRDEFVALTMHIADHIERFHHRCVIIALAPFALSLQKYTTWIAVAGFSSRSPESRASWYHPGR
jgi:hypothetical protein